MASIESELNSVLQSYSTNVYAWEVPDTDTSTEALAFQRLAERSNTTFYDKGREIKVTLFHVARVTKGYLELCEDSAFRNVLNKYTGGFILDIKITDSDDTKLDDVKYERLYTIEIMHVVTYQ
ncbi:hypothetical protein [Aeromonas sp. AE23HZ002T15]